MIGRTGARHFRCATFMAFALVSQGANAQTCAMKLSELEAATQDFARDTEERSAELGRLFEGFDRLEAQMANDPGNCPAELGSSRAGAAGFATGLDAPRSTALLDCAQWFNGKILRDIETARQQNDSQLVVRLGEVQRRIFGIEGEVVETAKQAMFLGFRAESLLRQHDVLTNRCALLGDLYD